MSAERLVAAHQRGEDEDVTLRPQRLADFIGQANVRANLKIFVDAARGRGERMSSPHVAHVTSSVT